MEWIDQVDGELSSLREAEARIYYQADVGGDLDATNLRAVAERRRALLTRDELMSRAASLAQEGGEPIARRRAELLRLQILKTRIDELHRRFGNELLTTAALRFIVKNYYETGNHRPWRERFPGLQASG